MERIGTYAAQSSSSDSENELQESLKPVPAAEATKESQISSSKRAKLATVAVGNQVNTAPEVDI